MIGTDFDAPIENKKKISLTHRERHTQRRTHKMGDKHFIAATNLKKESMYHIFLFF